VGGEVESDKRAWKECYVRQGVGGVVLPSGKSVSRGGGKRPSHETNQHLGESSPV